MFPFYPQWLPVFLQLNRTTKAVTIDGALLIEVDPAPVDLVIDGCTIQYVPAFPSCVLFKCVYIIIHTYYIHIIYILYIIVYIPIVLSFRFLSYLGKFPWPGATTGRGVHTSALGSRGKMMDFTMKNGGFHHQKQEVNQEKSGNVIRLNQPSTDRWCWEHLA